MQPRIETRTDPSLLFSPWAAPTRSVSAALGYLEPNGRRPCNYTYPPPLGVPWENTRIHRQAVSVTDARTLAGRPRLDAHGFELWHAPSAVRDFSDQEAITGTYYQEAAELALAVTGAQEAYVFDHLVRRRELARRPLVFGRHADDGTAAANGRVHNDYTEASGRRRLARVLGEDTDPRLVGRYAIVNIWRPTRAPVLDTPLALCDARSVSLFDLVEADVRYPDRTGEIYLTLHSPRHRWFYFSAMAPEEALVFKQYDSHISGVSRFTPHVAFDLPDPPPDAAPRESIEIRCLVVYG